MQFNGLLDELIKQTNKSINDPHIYFNFIFGSKLEQFKKDNAAVGFGSGTLAMEQAIESTKANIKWISENKEEVLKWFQDETKNPVPRPS